MRPEFEQQLKAMKTEEDALEANKIENLQKQKREWMDWLRQSLEQVKQGEKVEIKEKQVYQVIMGEDGRLYTTSAEGEDVEITKGDLFTDASWGLGYELDTSLPLDIRKKYILEYAKQKILSLLDRQILIEEINRGTEPRTSFQALEKRMKKNPEATKMDIGHQAETLVTNYLSKLIHNGQLGVEIKPADFFEDVVSKIDFIVYLPKETHGVEVATTSGDSKKLGVQLTLKTRKQQVLNKRAIIQEAFEQGPQGTVEVDDVVLLSLNEAYVHRTIKKWKQSGRPPGGPESFLEDKAQYELLHRLFDDLLGQNAVDRLVERLELAPAKQPVKGW